MKNFSWAISIIFHPMLMATYGCAFLFFGMQDTMYEFIITSGTKFRLTAIVFTFTFLLPMLNMVVMYKMKRLPNLVLSNQKDRTFPYLTTAIFYFGLFYLLMDLNIWNILKVFIVGAGLAIVLTALINIKYKISAHMVGIGGLLGVIIAASFMLQSNFTILYVVVILIGGLIGLSRVYLKEHSNPQIYLGFLLGICVQIGLFYGFQNFIFS
jgi:hypothetical protein